jgi:acetyl esterase/lipase
LWKAAPAIERHRSKEKFVLVVDPEIAALIPAVGIGTIDAETLPRVRSAPPVAPPPLSDSVERQDHIVPGDPDVLIRVHRPVGIDGELPCLYSMHGGGLVLGSYQQDDARFDAWCPKFSCVGVSVEYRLAPETPFPGPLDDCYRGLQWVYEHHRELGIDPDHLGVGGTSAGGCLAAALAQLARDRGEIPLRFQLLDCPMLDDRQITPSSQEEGLPIWNRHSNAFGWRSYLGDLYGTPNVPAYAAPARATDLSGLPPAYVCVGGADGFRDEDIDYAMRLSQAGVPTELHVHPGAPHGVMLFPKTPVAQRYALGIEEWVGRQLRAEQPATSRASPS